MSYCVNCGVKLDDTLERCPLCNTPVINPNEITYTHSVPPFPKENGQVETVKNKDVAILYSLVLIAAGAACGLLNLLVFNSSAWSLYVIGICIILWVVAIPVFIYTKLPIYVSLLFDGLSIGLYEYLITFNTPSSRWFLPAGPAYHCGGHGASHPAGRPVQKGFLFLPGIGALCVLGNRSPVYFH